MVKAPHAGLVLPPCRRKKPPSVASLFQNSNMGYFPLADRRTASNIHSNRFRNSHLNNSSSCLKCLRFCVRIYPGSGSRRTLNLLFVFVRVVPLLLFISSLRFSFFCLFFSLVLQANSSGSRKTGKIRRLAFTV